MKKSCSVNIMLNQDQGESGKEDSEKGKDPPVKPDEKLITVQKYEEEWEQIYCHNDPDLAELRQRAMRGNLRASSFRSVCWRALLGVFSNDKRSWLQELRRFRQHYQQMNKEFSTDPWGNDNPDDNPLNQNAGSSWNQHFCDMELKALIWQDIVRTSEEVEYFHKENVQKLMLNVLFVYARENPEMCYRQGMHEILAPLLFVLHCDHQALLHTRKIAPVSEAVNEILDPQYIEADAYALFCIIMDGIKHFYQINDVKPTATGYFPPNLESPILPPGDKSGESEIVLHLNSIRDNILVPNDKELADFLDNVEITLPVFGIRWLRLLFGREFPLQDLLVLWDAIFAEDKDFRLVDYILVTMLIVIRNLLIGADCNICLVHLMKYPGAVDVTYVIEHALYLKDKQKYSRPTLRNYPASETKSDSARFGRHSRSQSLNSAGSMTSLNSAEKGQQQKSRMTSGSSITDRFKKLSSKTSPWSSGKVPSSVVRKENDTSSASTSGAASGTAAGTGIVEGFALNDPTVLISELNLAYSVMDVCSNKLAKYYGIISQAVNTEEYPEAMQALVGMSELCNLLNSRKRSRAFHLEVEAAYEAGESRVEHQTVPIHISKASPPQRSATPPNQLSLRGVSDKTKKRDAVSTSKGSSHINPSDKNRQLKTFKESSENSSEIGKRFPLKDPLKSMKRIVKNVPAPSNDDDPVQVDRPMQVERPVQVDRPAQVDRPVSENRPRPVDQFHLEPLIHPNSFVIL